MKKILSLFLLELVMTLGMVLFFDTGTITASADIYGDLTYSLSNGEIEVTGCDISATFVTIPSSINGYPVTSIGDHAFYNCEKLTNLTIPESVTSIGDYTFYYCRSLTSISIPDGVTSIGNCTFYCSGLTSIYIPKSVTSIGDSAFYGCSGLASISVDVANTVYHSKDNCLINTADKVLILGTQNSVIPSDGSVTRIGSSAFSGCTGLSSISIPSSVTSIGYSAFYNCRGLASITISNGVKSIGNSAFYYCTDLTSISIPNSVTSIGSYAFCYCTDLTSISIPDSVTSIGNSAFRGSGLTSITIGNGVTSIGDKAFYNCSSLTSISIPSSVTSIGEEAFYGCPKSIYNTYSSGYYLGNINNPFAVLIDTIGSDMTSFTIHPNTNNINSRVFASCRFLTSINIPDSVTSIGSSAFSGCTGLMSVNIPESVTSIGEYAFYYCTDLTSISIPNSVTSIGENAFYGCDSLTSISVDTENTVYQSKGNCLIKTADKVLVTGLKTSVIPSDGSVTSIGKGAFSGCSGLMSVNIPESVTSIGEDAFYGCIGLTRVDITDVASWCNICFSDYYANPLYYAKNLYLNDVLVTELIIPSGVTNIGEFLFRGCTGLTSIDIPDSVTSIGDSAFYDCTNLKSVSIPDGVTSIGTSAFEGCSGLVSVSFGDNSKLTSIEDYTFNSCSGLTSINLPNSVTSIGDSAFYDCTNLKSVSIPDGVTSIGTSAFNSCSGLVSVSFEGNSKLTSIDWLAFAQCVRLASINLPNSVTSIGDSAFYGCTNLKSVSIGDGVTRICERAFEGCSGLTSVSFGDNSKLTSIEDYAFYRCSGLTSVNIPKGVVSIGDAAFCYCTGLTSITIPDSVTSIVDNPFSGCSGLTSITVDANNPVFHSKGNCLIYTADKVLVAGSKTSVIPSDGSVTSIGDGAFLGCRELAYIMIPDGITTIDTSAFFKCSNLTSISIPGSVTSIGWYAFEDCTELKTVYYCGTETQWSNISIDSNNNLMNAARFYHKYSIITEPTCTEDGIKSSKCEFCGFETEPIMPALGHRVIVDAITFQNDSKYPFSLSDGVYSSTNKAHSSKSIFTITAAYDCSIKLEYSVSSEEYCDKLIISKNGTALYTKSGIVAWTSVDILLNAGETLTISYTKNISTSANDDTGYFKFYADMPADECEPTCTQAVICSICQIEVKQILEHSYCDWCVEREPDERSDGSKSRVCSECGYEELKVIYFASGDVDGDGELSNSDITLAIRAMSGWDSSDEVARVDVNYDGIINNRDIIVIIQKIAGWN